MSINNLFRPNDYNLYANNINANNLSVQNMNIADLSITGDLILDNDAYLGFSAWYGTDATKPEHIKIYNDDCGIGLTFENLNIIAPPSSNINNIINGKTITTINDTEANINRNTKIISGVSGTDTKLSLLSSDIVQDNIILEMGGISGKYQIKRDKTDKSLNFLQSGDSVGSNINLDVGTGYITQYGLGGLQTYGNLKSNGALYINDVLYDKLGSVGISGQILTTTGTGTQWATQSIPKQIFMNSHGATLINSTYIGLAGLSTNAINCTYSLANNSTFIKMFVQISHAPNIGNGWHFILQKDGIDTAFYTIIVGNDTQGTQTGNIPYSEGSNYSVRIEKINSPPSVSDIYLTLVYE